MSLHSEYHYDGDCGIAKFFMRLSGWTISEFALRELPNGYVANGGFGPRVEKYDWFELLAKFPLLIALLVIAGITTLFWLFWLCCKVQGLQKSKRKRHRCCHCFTTFLLLLLLLPLAIGLYLTFRANYLLRRGKVDSQSYKDTARSALDDEHGSFLNPAVYEASPSQLSKELNKAITNEFADWQQLIAQNKQNIFEQLKYLDTNREFYRTALQALKKYAYELVIIGLEMDDLLRTFFREALIFLQSNVNNTSLIESGMVQREHINVWHLNSVYLQYTHTFQYLEYLLKAYENVSLLQTSIAESTPNAALSETDLLEDPTLRGFPQQHREEKSSQADPKIPSTILYLSMFMFFVTAALAYILLMALGFGICRYYERANCMLKTFLFLNILTIPVLAFLMVLHFLPTMVLHTGICHEKDFRAYRTAEFRQCSPLSNTNEAIGFENDELSTTAQMRDNILTKVGRMLSKNNIFNKNYTSNQHDVEEFPQEKWYESDVQGLITNEDILKYENYVKEHSNITGTEIFSCKLNSIPNAVETDLYRKEFVPIATELHEEITKFKKHAQSTGYDSFTKLLESAHSELIVFVEFYALSKDKFLPTLSKRLDKKLDKYSKSVRNHLKPCSTAQRSAMNEFSKCGCLEDLLVGVMIYALGSALLVFTLFFATLLSLLLYKLYKRGPPICASPPPPKSDECSGPTPAAVIESPCEPNTCTTAQTTANEKDCVVNVKSDMPSQSPQMVTNCGVAPTGVPLINTVNFIPPVMGAFGCQQSPPMMYPTNCQQNPPQSCTTACQHNSPQRCATACQPNPAQMCGCNRNDGVILPLPCRSRTQMSCGGAEAQLVGGGTTNDKTVTVMVFQGPKDRQPLVTYPPPRAKRYILFITEVSKLYVNIQPPIMKLSEFKTLPVVPYTSVDICGLPFSIQAIIQAFATKESLSLPRSLTEEYMNCTGLGYKLLNNDWRDYVAEFPWLIALLIYSALLPILCLVWCIFQFRPKRVRRFERPPVPSWRYILSTLLFLLKILYSFFIWFTYTSYQNHPTRSYREPESNVNMVKILYDQTLDVIDHVSTENIEVVQEFMKKLADEIITSLNSSAPEIVKNPAGSMLTTIYTDSVDIQPILKDMRSDMRTLLANIMQLTDLTRLFHRNTTTFLLMSNISDPTYMNLIYNELNGNAHKIVTLLNIERVLSNIEDIVTMSLELPGLRKAFAKSLTDLHSYYGSVFTNMWAEKVNEMNANYLEIVKAVKKLRTEVPRDVMIHLPNDIYSYQLFFLIIAIMISVLCWMQLCYAVYHTISMRFKKKKYILVSIVVFICVTSIILCLIASLSFLVGTSFFNFREDTSSLDNPCGLESKSYCDSQDKILGLLAESAFGPQAEIYNAMQLQNQRVFEALRVALPSVAGISNILQMLQYADYSGTVFNSGDMFNVMKREMNMENWYAACERLRSHVPIAVGASLDNKSALYEKMLACNLHLVKTHVLETLMPKNIVENVNALSKNAQRLAALLPTGNLTTLLRKGLGEMRILHDYFEIEFKDLLNSKMQQLLMDFDLEMMLYTSHVAFMPNCRDFKMSSVGIPRQLYECIESCLHGFWIGAFSILILLFPILIICMLLAYLYDRYPYSTQTGASSRSPPPDDDASRTSSTSTVSNAAPGDEPVNEPNPPESNWRDRFGSRLKRAHVTFKTPPATDDTNKVANAQRSSTSKIRDLIYSILSSAPSTTPPAETKLSGSTTTSEESSEVEIT